MAASITLRAIDRQIRIARTIRAQVLKLALRPQFTPDQAKAHLLTQLTYTYNPDDADEIVALYSAYRDLPPSQRFLVAHGKFIAIWRGK